MAQYVNDANYAQRFLTARGARAMDAAGTVARIDTSGIDTHRMRYGHRHARGADWYAENAREYARIDGGRMIDADRVMLADGATRAGVTVAAFTAALLASPRGQSVPTGMDARTTARPTADAPTVAADALADALLSRTATAAPTPPKRRRR